MTAREETQGRAMRTRRADDDRPCGGKDRQERDEQMIETICSIISALAPGIIVGIVLAWWNRRDRKRDEARSSAEADRLESEMMRIDLLVAVAQLSYAVAIAQKRGSTNGETEIGIGHYEKAMDKFRKFERKQMAKSGMS